MTHEEALKYVTSQTPPNLTENCLMNGRYHYVQEGGPSRDMWNLVCERKFWRTFVQTALFTGKQIGAYVFGMVADKYGRKTGCVISCF